MHNINKHRIAIKKCLVHTQVVVSESPVSEVSLACVMDGTDCSHCPSEHGGPCSKARPPTPGQNNSLFPQEYKVGMIKNISIMNVTFTVLSANEWKLYIYIYIVVFCINRRNGDGNFQENTAWGKCMEESGRVIGDRHISQKLKGKVLGSCITPAYLNGLETMAMTEKQQEKLQVCKNNQVRRIAGVKRIDKRRMEELTEEVGVRESLTRELVGERGSQGSW